jgi:hypothetical protein
MPFKVNCCCYFFLNFHYIVGKCNVLESLIPDYITYQFVTEKTYKFVSLFEKNIEYKFVKANSTSNIA